MSAHFGDHYRCPDEEALSARLDEALEPDETARVDEHLTACAPCRQRWDELCAVREALRSLPPRQVPDDVVEAAARSAQAERVRQAQRARSVMLAAAVGLALATGAVLDHHGTGVRGDEPIEVSDEARLIEAMDREQLVEAVARERITRVPPSALEYATGEGGAAALELVDDPARDDVDDPAP